jgi:hypothetical protein
VVREAPDNGIRHVAVVTDWTSVGARCTEYRLDVGGTQARKLTESPTPDWEGHELRVRSETGMGTETAAAGPA